MDAQPVRRIYAIGDIHGRLDLLEILAGKVALHLEDHPSENAVIVLLGDYIDRGPQSAGVIDWLLADQLPAPSVLLRGNHEATLLNFLDDDRVLESWRQFGGLETLVSYGVDVRDAMRGRNYATAQAQLKALMPPEHLDFLERTRLFWTSGDYFFCHAGVRPGVALARQQERDLLWIREDFTEFRGRFEKVVVHGHSPAPSAELLPNRINVDTGAYATDVLTCVILDGEKRNLLAT